MIQALSVTQWKHQYWIFSWDTWEFMAVHEEKTVFPVYSPSSSVSIVHTVDGALLVVIG
jgi:hypothetical protein